MVEDSPYQTANTYYEPYSSQLGKVWKEGWRTRILPGGAAFYRGKFSLASPWQVRTFSHGTYPPSRALTPHTIFVGMGLTALTRKYPPPPLPPTLAMHEVAHC